MVKWKLFWWPYLHDEYFYGISAFAIACTLEEAQSLIISKYRKHYQKEWDAIQQKKMNGENYHPPHWTVESKVKEVESYFERNWQPVEIYEIGDDRYQADFQETWR